MVAGGLGVDLPLRTAVAAYYRSLFLNVTLPGGIVGDVHRGISHGRESRDVGLGLRAVAWERSAGQAVQILLTIAVLLVLPSPVRAVAPLVAVAVLGVVVGAADLRSRPAGTASGRGGRGCAAPPAAIFVTASSPAGRGRRSPSPRRSSSPAMPSPS